MPFLKEAQRAEIPDVLDYADIRHGGTRYIKAVTKALNAGAPVGGSWAVEYPKDGSSLRVMSVPEPRDALALRVAAAPLVAALDCRAHRGVWSARCRTGPPGWVLVKNGTAWHRLKSRARKLCQDSSVGAVLHADVRAYYATISRDRLVEALEAVRLPTESVALVDHLLAGWELSGLRGLPIGPAGSGIFGTAFLMPVDDLFPIGGIPYLRFTDDMFAFPASHDAAWDLVTEIEDRLGAIGLALNTTKTTVGRPDEARHEWFSRSPLGSLDDGTTSGAGLTPAGAARVVVSEVVQGVKTPQRFKYALGALRNTPNAIVSRLLLETPSVLSAFPKPVCEYLLSAGPLGDPLLAAVTRACAQTPEASHHARDLHLGRLIVRERRGTAEAQALLIAGLDPRRPGPCRATLLFAAGVSGALSRTDAGDLALDVRQDFLVRRAALATLKGRDSRGTAALLRDRRISQTRLQWTGRWVSAHT